MAAIKGKTLFFTTSPRTPLRMLPEIELLTDNLEGQPWNKDTQTDYMYILFDQDFYQGSKELKDPAFSARDRINRSPKALGFVDLSPEIKLTDAGKTLISSKHIEEPLLRQLLKFQLPSPFHTIPRNKDVDFWIKPYLEIIRLIRTLGSVSFDEIQLFGMQLTNYQKFESIVEKINQFRKDKALHKGSYKQFFSEESERTIREIYSEEFLNHDMRTRESDDKSAKNFILTKRRNLRDYTDACFRYLRATGFVMISQSGRSLSISADKTEEIDFILKTVSREPIYVDNRKNYKKYLYNPEIPQLYSDDIGNLKSIVNSLDSSVKLENLSVIELKDIQHDLLDRKKEEIIESQTIAIKDYDQFDDIIKVFSQIPNRDSYYDRPLMFEWNAWRAMTMIDGGNIHANLNFDDLGMPLSTASGNMSDIVCDYGDFMLNVEVTLQSGQKQYDNEGEPVARHVGKVKATTGKPTFCFFIAPSISDATIAHFYTLQHTSVRLYGGKTNIIPLELDTFVKMVLDSRKADYVPEPNQIKRLVESVHKLADEAEDEIDWFNRTTKLALNWLDCA
ncbi:MAG: AlwI family type II restriction endonuclease [Gordonibacter sp.]|uniref:AlwI family type II restriction endonuclease n=1 Tax=Gordonibacter sp. TaxID=1968902 RepID=UPI002FC5DFFC